METFLIYGHTGWIGSQLKNLLTSDGKRVICGTSRIENRESVLMELETHKPTVVFNCAGITGRPNVDWCEDHKIETVRTNVIGTLNLADCCNVRGIHLTNFATGCIFDYDDTHLPNSNNGFTEEDTPNYHGSWYSHTKAITEDLLKQYPNVLTLRMRLPLALDNGPRDLLSKLIKFKKVINIPNSITVLPTLLPIAIELSERREVGILNFTNPGVITHGEILDMYKEYVDNTHVYETFTIDEQSKLLKTSRCNCELDTTKLETLFGQRIPTSKEAIKRYYNQTTYNCRVSI